MKRETITISVPAGMKKYILARGSNEFGSVSEYIRKLVRQDQNSQRGLAMLRYNRSMGKSLSPAAAIRLASAPSKRPFLP